MIRWFGASGDAVLVPIVATPEHAVSGGQPADAAVHLVAGRANGARRRRQPRAVLSVARACALACVVMLLLLMLHVRRNARAHGDWEYGATKAAGGIKVRFGIKGAHNA